MLTTVAAGRVYDYSDCIGMYSQGRPGILGSPGFRPGIERSNLCVEPRGGTIGAACHQDHV